MKIAFVYSEGSNYTEFTEKIIEHLRKRVKKEIEHTKIISKVTRKKYDLYVVISNDIEDFKFNLAKIKNKPLLITNNLKSKFIENVIHDVLDIVYLQSKPEIIVNRIIGNMEKVNAQKS